MVGGAKGWKRERVKEKERQSEYSFLSKFDLGTVKINHLSLSKLWQVLPEAKKENRETEGC